VNQQEKCIIGRQVQSRWTYLLISNSLNHYDIEISFILLVDLENERKNPEDFEPAAVASAGMNLRNNYYKCEELLPDICFLFTLCRQD
jgi:hypothetical protein